MLIKHPSAPRFVSTLLDRRSLLGRQRERYAHLCRLNARCCICSLEGFRNLGERLLAGHALETTKIVFRPRSPDWRFLVSHDCLGHVRSYLVDQSKVRMALCTDYSALQLSRGIQRLLANVRWRVTQL